MIDISMMNRLNLQLFADGGTGAAGAGANGSAAGSQGASGDLSAVQYGIDFNAEEAVETSEQPDTQTQEESFDSLIKGRFKDDYDRNVQAIIQRRVKGMQATVDAYNKALPMIEGMAQKYGITDPADIEAIVNAFDADDQMLEHEAEERNIPVEELRNIRKLQRENNAFRNKAEQQDAEKATDAIVQGWQQQAAEARAVYPNLDLQTECQNPRFAGLLRNGLDVRTAYEVVHKDDIITAGMQIASQKAAEKVARSVAAGAKRPSEGGNGSGVAAIHKADPSQLTRNDLKEIYRRVARGERVSFG